MQSGLAPARDSIRVPLPLPIMQQRGDHTAVVPDHQARYLHRPVRADRVDGQQLNLTLLNSITAMSRRALRDDMPGIILRTTVRAITKGVAQKQINETNPLAGLAVGISSAVLEGADTRTWRTLPDNTQVVRLRLKKGEHQVTLPSAVGGSVSRSPSISAIKSSVCAPWATRCSPAASPPT